MELSDEYRGNPEAISDEWKLGFSRHVNKYLSLIGCPRSKEDISHGLERIIHKAF